MSLAVLADHMASKGRGPDSMLIHMSPREVQGLQALAMKHGGSLSINPETGLPEAGFLDKLLPAIIGFALAPLTAGTSLAFLGATPFASAMTVGALETLRTGDIGKGIRAGAGAYGGAGLQAGLATAGTGAISSEVGGEALKAAGLTGDAALTAEADQVIQKAVGERLAASTPYETIAAGANKVTSSPEAFGSFAKNNFKNIAYTAAPILADQAVRSNMPTTTTRPGAVRTFSYDPYGQLYTPTGNYEVPVKAAGGGLMGMDDGGYAPGQLNFAQQSEPVVRMAVGGQTVEDLYKSIGRTPDKEGLAFWQSNFGTGPVTADQAASFMQSANSVLSKLPPAEQMALAPTLAAKNAATATNTTGGLSNLAATNGIVDVTGAGTVGAGTVGAGTVGAGTVGAGTVGAGTVGATGGTSLPDAQLAVNNIYRNVLGRDADAVGLNFWSNAIANGRSVDSVYQDILKSANEIKQAGTLGDFGIKTMTAADATKPYAGFTSTAGNTIADEFVRNVLGREPTDADRAQSWYKDAANLGTTADASKVYSDFLKSAGTEASSNVAKKIADAKALLASKGLTEADVLRQTNKTIAELVGSGANLNLGFMQAAQLKPLGSASTGFDFSTITKPETTVASTFDTTNPYGNNTGNALTSTPGDLTKNADGTITVQPNIPGRPEGGFPGMGAVKDAYTAGGGSLGYIPYAPKTIEEFDAKYNKLTGGSKEAYDRLTGKTKYSPTPYTETGEVMKPYAESVLGVPRSLSSKKVLFDPATRTYKNNPDYIPVSYTDKGEKVYGLSSRDIAAQLPDVATSDYEKWTKDNNVTLAQIAEALNISLAEAKKRYPLVGSKTDTTDDTAYIGNSYDLSGGGGGDANGGLMKLADGGITGSGQLNLNIPLNLGGSGGSNGYGAMGGGFGSMPSNFANKLGSAMSNNMNGGLPDFRNQIDSLEQQVQKLPSVMAYSDYGKSISGRPPTTDETGQMEQLRKTILGDKDFLGLQSQMQSMGNKYQQQAMGSQSPGLQQRYMQQTPNAKTYANGGLAAMADGGMAGQFNLGGYSDGGRLLRGPGDGVSDSIPATIGNKRPARLADGEFVVPARIVSELGNGSTEAGARKLYAMMDRVQRARRSTVGKGKVAKNSRSDKYLPA
jgi:hypothetical protein